MAFRNFVVSGGAKEVSFILKDPKDVSYGVGSLSVSVNNNYVDASPVVPLAIVHPPKPVNTEETPQLVENVADSDDPPSEGDEQKIVGSSGIADRVQNRKGTSQRPLKATPNRKLNIPTPTSRSTRQKTEKSLGKAVMYSTEQVADDDDIHGLSNTKELPNALTCHLLVENVTPASWRRTLNDMSIEGLCDLHDKSYTRQAMLDNHLNTRTRELVRMVKDAMEEVAVIVAREKSREKQYAELESKCDAVVADFEMNPRYEALWDKIDSLEEQLKESQGKLTMEEAEISGYKTQVAALESKCTGLEAERVRLVKQEIKLCQDMDGLKLECKSLKKDRA